MTNPVPKSKDVNEFEEVDVEAIELLKKYILTIAGHPVDFNTINFDKYLSFLHSIRAEAEKRGEEKERDKCKFNTDEIYKEWLDNFYEDDWTVYTMKLTDFEKQIIGELTTFLPRHMAPYDWNLPFAEAIVLIIRNLLKGRKIITDNSLTHQKG